eukprot:scpid69507/ scgid28427/ 
MVEVLLESDVDSLARGHCHHWLTTMASTAWTGCQAAVISTWFIDGRSRTTLVWVDKAQVGVGTHGQSQKNGQAQHISYLVQPLLKREMKRTRPTVELKSSKHKSVK